MRKDSGVALVVTLLAAVALLVVVVAIVGTLSLSNRKISTNKSVELEAQYAAESGVEQSAAVLAEFRDLISKAQVDLSAGNPAVEHLIDRLAAFCYGPSPLDETARATMRQAIKGHGDYECDVDTTTLKHDLKDGTLSDADLGKRWMPFFYDYIERSVYEDKNIVSTSDDAETYKQKVYAYWGQVLRGTQLSLQRTLESGPEGQVRYRIATDSNAGIVPTRMVIGGGEVNLYFGSLSGKERIVSIGEVLDASGRVLARRVVQIGNEGETRLALSIRAPSYAWYAFFFDKQNITNPEHPNPRKLIVFTDQTVIDGPVHANDYLAFEKGSRPWFGGPVSSAGPDRRDWGIRAYWRETIANEAGYEVPPSGVDAEHWWDLENTEPEFAIATDALGQKLCYNPLTKVEEVCKNVDADGDGEPDPPWVYKRDVNWDHAEIPLPGTDAIDELTEQAIDGGIFISADEFCYTSTTKRIPVGSPPPEDCVGRYLKGEGRGKITLEADGDTQIIRIDLIKVTGWKFVKTEKPWWQKHQNCPPSGGGGGGGGGGGVHRLEPLFRKLGILPPPLAPFAFSPGTVYATSWYVDPTGEACAEATKPTCKEGCTCTYTCIKARDRYDIETTHEYLVLSYSKSDPRLKVVAQEGPMSAVIYNTSTPFNGTLVAEPSKFYVRGPNKDDASDSPEPAIAEFAQITVASPYDIHITGDLTYAKPACNKTPHRDIADEDGDGDTDEIIDRCTEEDYQDAAPNLLGIYARNIYLNPKGVWSQEGADLTVHAVLMAYNGKIETKNVSSCWRKELGRFKLLGGLIQKKIGALNWRRKCSGTEKLLGYRTAFAYDQRMLKGLAPPGFPRFVEGRWGADFTEVEAGAPGFWRHVPEK